MSLNFLSLPLELRDQIYKLVLLQDEPIIPWIKGHSYIKRRPKLTSGLLRANKAIYLETKSLLYGRNCFNITLMLPNTVSSFFEQIGRNNAEHIRHLLINFPEFFIFEYHGHHWPKDADYLHYDGCLATIKDHCVNLTTLTTSLQSTNYELHQLAQAAQAQPKCKPHIMIEVINLVDTHFRSIPSLHEIIAETRDLDYMVHQDKDREEMELLGWTISFTEYGLFI